MELSVRIERWPLAGAFTISRGSKTEAVVVVAELSDGTHRGRGESVPYARYGETPDGIVAAIEAMRPALRPGLGRDALQAAMPPGAARNALDCAYWDVNARQIGRRAYRIGRACGARATGHRLYDFARFACGHGASGRAGVGSALLKVKLGGGGDDRERIAAVRRAAPRAELIVDANEGWTEDNLAQNLAACADAGVTLIEQPLPEGRDGALARIKRPIPICADESVHARASLDCARRQI